MGKEGGKQSKIRRQGRRDRWTERRRRKGNDVMGEKGGKQSKIRRQGRRDRWTESEKRMQ